MACALSFAHLCCDNGLLTMAKGCLNLYIERQRGPSLLDLQWKCYNSIISLLSSTEEIQVSHGSKEKETQLCSCCYSKKWQHPEWNPWPELWSVPPGVGCRYQSNCHFQFPPTSAILLYKVVGSYSFSLCSVRYF